MPTRPSSKKLDFTQIAVEVVEAATQSKLSPEPFRMEQPKPRLMKRRTPPPKRKKNPSAIALGRLGASKGGKARAQNLSPQKRSQIAKKAAAARWSPKAKRMDTINPDMISLARESRGLTQTELANRLSIPQARLSKIESGVLPITEEILKRIAQALEYPERFFFLSDTVRGLGPSMMYHRKRLSLSPRQLKYIHAQINIRCIHISQLLR